MILVFSVQFPDLTRLPEPPLSPVGAAICPMSSASYKNTKEPYTKCKAQHK